jgi:hypothetical protein
MTLPAATGGGDEGADEADEAVVDGGGDDAADVCVGIDAADGTDSGGAVLATGFPQAARNVSTATTANARRGKVVTPKRLVLTSATPT